MEKLLEFIDTGAPQLVDGYIIVPLNAVPQSSGLVKLKGKGGEETGRHMRVFSASQGHAQENRGYKLTGIPCPIEGAPHAKLLWRLYDLPDQPAKTARPNQSLIPMNMGELTAWRPAVAEAVTEQD